MYLNYCMPEVLSLCTYFVTYLVVTSESELYILFILTVNSFLSRGNGTTIIHNT
jgi:hypothetical protein